jgi:hypothetical protein
MEELGQMFETAIQEWRVNKGIGTAFVPPKLNSKVLVLGILQRVYSRSPTIKTLIVVETFNERTDLVEFLTHQENEEENNAEFKKLLDNRNIKVLTADFLNNAIHIERPMFCIIYKLSEISGTIKTSFISSKFRLAVISNLMSTSEDNAFLYKEAPVLNCFTEQQMQAIRVSTPVKEMCIGLILPEDSEDYKLLKYYDEYITTSLNIFGTFDCIKEACYGNSALNVSAVQVCNRIATDNGWNESLDMSIEYNRQIDELYNPVSIRDRASMTYEVIRNRQTLIASNNIKLDAIFNYVNEHKDEKILIISRHSSFAKKITDYLNTMSENVICGDYHNNVESIPAVDVDGNPIYIKSGKHKGERKMMAATAQKRLNIELFECGTINILSTNNAPDKELDVKIDRILISSPLCSDIKSYLYRLDKLLLPPTLNVDYIYIKGTQEEKVLRDKELSIGSGNIKNSEIDSVDSNFSDFVIAD